MQKPMLTHFDQIDPVPCPCGQARRAFAGNPTATLHRVDIDGEAEYHYHREHTEVYYILDCDPGSAIELDGEVHPLKAGMAIFIPPGVRHRAMGRLQILNFAVPSFDPEDEHVD